MNHKFVMLRTVLFLSLASLMMTWVYAFEPMKEDNQHIRTWNKFAMDCLELHKKLTGGKHLDVKTRIGGYAHNKDFYKEERYFDNGHLVSQVQWERENPTRLHSIEVYLRDKNGRVMRDFIAAYLPHYHNAPTQTLISFHHYNGGLHAFRSFDASGYRVLERCNGKNKKGEVVNIILDEDELAEDPDNVMNGSNYKQCFAGLKQTRLGKYLIPH